jgi:glycerate kinase
VIALSGCLTPDSAAVHEHGIAAVFSAVRRPCTVEEALRDAAVNVRSAAYNVASALSLGMRIEASRRARPGIQATDTRLPARP